MLGMAEEARFRQVPFELPAGDLLLLTTDGIVEAPCAGGGQFGVEGIVAFLEGYAGDSPLDGLLQEVRRRSIGTSPADDISAVMVAPA